MNIFFVTTMVICILFGRFILINKILSIGIPSGIENGMFQIGKLLVVSMVATLGTDAIAANSISYQIIDFPNIPGMFADWYVRGICYSLRYLSSKWLTKEVI